MTATQFIRKLMKKTLVVALLALLAISANAADKKEGTTSNKPVFTVVKQIPITSIKDQNRSGTCWDYSTLSYFEALSRVENTYTNQLSLGAPPLRGGWVGFPTRASVPTLWCSICLASLPDTDELAKEDGDDFVVLTVVSPGQKGEQSEEAFKKWYQGLDYKALPVLLDPSGQLLASYGVRSYPTQAFIDKEGKLVKTQPGFMDKETILENLKTMN